MINKNNESESTWKTLNSMSFPRMECTSFIDSSGKIYVIGGIPWNKEWAQNPFKIVEMFDPITGNWTTLDSCNISEGLGVSVIDSTGKIYIVNSSHNKIECFDPITKKVNNIGLMLKEKDSFTSVINSSGQIYIIGGSNKYGGYRCIIPSVECFSTSTRTWINVNPLNIERISHTSLIDSLNRIYVIGGVNINYEIEWWPYNKLSSVERFDPITGNWTMLNSMSEPRWNHTSLIDSTGKIYVIGGIGKSGKLSSVECFDPITGNWTTLNPMSEPRSHHTSLIDSTGKIYVIGGIRSDGYTLSSVEYYDPDTGIWNNLPFMSKSRCNHTSIIDSNDIIYVFGGYHSSSTYKTDFNPLYDIGKFHHLSSVESFKISKK